MKIGDLVRSRNTHMLLEMVKEESDWVGIIIDFKGLEPVVYWNERFPEEIEYPSQLQVVTPRKKEEI